MTKTKDKPDPETQPEPEQGPEPETEPMPEQAPLEEPEPEEEDLLMPTQPQEAPEPADVPEPAVGDVPLPKTFIILNGPASYGPVRINGKLTRVKKDRLYQVSDPSERADILGTGRFRAATQKDLQRAAQPSAGPGGAITREMLPPGALKGGLAQKG